MIHTMYALAKGQPIPRDVEQYDGALVAGQNITIILDEDDVWQVRGDDASIPMIKGDGCTYVHGQRGGVVLLNGNVIEHDPNEFERVK